MKKFLPAVLFCAILFSCNDTKTDEKTAGEATTVSSTETKKPATEILDSSGNAAVRQAFDAFANGDIDGFTANYDDQVRFYWSGGDSLIGKTAVKDYYAGRRKLIQSIQFSNHIFLPMQINESQNAEVVPPGKWLLHWVNANVTYNNGKTVNFWMHNASMYNEAGKVITNAQYIDRLPLMEATKDLPK